jgi:hypothetical protein
MLRQCTMPFRCVCRRYGERFDVDQPAYGAGKLRRIRDGRPLARGKLGARCRASSAFGCEISRPSISYAGGSLSWPELPPAIAVAGAASAVGFECAHSALGLLVDYDSCPRDCAPAIRWPGTSLDLNGLLPAARTPSSVRGLIQPFLSEPTRHPLGRRAPLGRVGHWLPLRATIPRQWLRTQLQ